VGSVKRKEPEGPSFAEIVTGDVEIVSSSIDVSDLTLDVAKVSSLVEKAATDVNNADIDPAVVSVFDSICDAMRGICKVQDKLVTAALKSKNVNSEPFTPVIRNSRPQNNMISLGAIPKRQRGPLSMSQPAGNVGTAADGADLCSFAGAGTSAGIVAGTSVGKTIQQNTGSSGNVISQEKRISGAGARSGQEREDPAIRKFKDCVRDAERSSLILNLN
jgi:hypothetical protein